MITKDQFTQAIEFVLEQERKDNVFEKALITYSGDEDFTGWSSNTGERIVSWLKKVMNDESDLISWWLWDAPNHGEDEEGSTIIYPSGAKKVLATPGDVYDCLLSEHEQGTQNTDLILKTQRETIKFAVHVIKETARKADDLRMSELLNLLTLSLINQYCIATGDEEIPHDGLITYHLVRKGEE